MALSPGPLSLNQIVAHFAAKKYEARRETLYRNLETLVEHGWLDKSYDASSKRLVYQLEVRKVAVAIDDKQISSQVG